MPNFDPDHCLEHSIDNEKQNLSWIDRDDTHCFHGSKCCWCARTSETQPTGGRHGKHAPKPRKRERKDDDTPPAPLEAEPIDGGAARMRPPEKPKFSHYRQEHDYESEMEYWDPNFDL